MALATGLAAGCGDETEPPAGGNLTIARSAASGDGQSGPAGAELAEPLSVTVTEDGAPAADVPVAWNVLTGGGSMAAASSNTSAQGIATMRWTLGAAVGNQTARAVVNGAAGSPVAFSATAVAGEAANLAVADGSGQSAEAGAALADPLQARVTDGSGNGVAGITVTWTVTAGGGSVNPASSATNGSGIATTVWTLGDTEGAQEVEASVDGLAGPPATFTATGTAAPDPNGVVVTNNAFTPATRTVSAGTTVTWTWQNTGSISHNVESVGTPGFTSSPILQGNGQTYSVTFDTPGTYDYECVVHGSAMSGTVVVQ